MQKIKGTEHSQAEERLLSNRTPKQHNPIVENGLRSNSVESRRHFNKAKMTAKILRHELS